MSDDEKRKLDAEIMAKRRNAIKAIEAYAASHFKLKSKLVQIQPETLAEFSNIALDLNDLLDAISNAPGQVEITIKVFKDGVSSKEEAEIVHKALHRLLFTSSVDRKPKREPKPKKVPIVHGPN